MTGLITFSPEGTPQPAYITEYAAEFARVYPDLPLAIWDRRNGWVNMKIGGSHMSKRKSEIIAMTDNLRALPPPPPHIEPERE